MKRHVGADEFQAVVSADAAALPLGAEGAPAGGARLRGVLDFRAVRRRRAAGLEAVSTAPVTGARTAIAVVVGLVAWMLFAFHLHRSLIGVSPFPGFH